MQMVKFRIQNSLMCLDLRSLTTNKFYNEEVHRTKRLTNSEKVTYLNFQQQHNLFFSSESCLICWSKSKIFAKTLLVILFLT